MVFSYKMQLYAPYCCEEISGMFKMDIFTSIELQLNVYNGHLSIAIAN